MNEKVDQKTLLSRKQFRTLGLAKTNGMCCIPGCKNLAMDAHHIMDRGLFFDGGYYLSNCAPVCYDHHYECEIGKITPNQLIEYLDIDYNDLVKPDKLDWLSDEEYVQMLKNDLIDKWGE